ncbi:MAG: hypothetical protein FWG56_10955 [Desulfovibrionaceae bacterium]|nr:hypothetical protein [Desulfovibrionaceae bacterium]
MQIHLKQPGQPVADFAVAGAVVTVAGVSIDCAARQQDTAVMIEIRANGGSAGEGGSGAYLAQIEIPARRRESATAQGDDGQIGPPPLDANAVSVTLWPTA